MTTATRYTRIRQQLDEECRRAGRNPEDVLLLAVSKTVDVDQVELAMQAGATAFGENRPDELLRKHAAFPQAEWHFIGNIQSRRIADIVSAATLIHSVCKEEHLAKINAVAERLGKVQRVLLEVNVSGEESKSGFEPAEVQGIIQRAAGLENVRIEGLMTMAPRAEADLIETTFSGLAALRDELNARAAETGTQPLSALSMGMTEDWPRAVAWGTTIVRVGRAIFSDDFE